MNSNKKSQSYFLLTMTLHLLIKVPLLQTKINRFSIICLHLLGLSLLWYNIKLLFEQIIFRLLLVLLSGNLLFILTWDWAISNRHIIFNNIFNCNIHSLFFWSTISSVVVPYILYEFIFTVDAQFFFILFLDPLFIYELFFPFFIYIFFLNILNFFVLYVYNLRLIF